MGVGLALWFSRDRRRKTESARWATRGIRGIWIQRHSSSIERLLCNLQFLGSGYISCTGSDSKSRREALRVIRAMKAQTIYEI